LRRQHVEDARDVGHEAHVEHAVGFVKNQRLHRVEADALVFDVVEQSTGCGHENLDTLLQFGNLRPDIDAAKGAHRAQVRVLAVGLDRFIDLQGKFAGRREDQGAYRMFGRRRAAARKGQDALQDGQREGGRLAGAGLGAAHDVLAADDERNCLSLDRRRLGITLFENRAQQFRGQAEIGKGNFGSGFCGQFRRRGTGCVAS